MGRDPLTIVYTDTSAASRAHAIYLSPFFPEVEGPGRRAGVSREHEDGLIGGARVDAAKRGLSRTHNDGQEARRD